MQWDQLENNSTMAFPCRCFNPCCRIMLTKLEDGMLLETPVCLRPKARLRCIRNLLFKVEGHARPNPIRDDDGKLRPVKEMLEYIWEWMCLPAACLLRAALLLFCGVSLEIDVIPSEESARSLHKALSTGGYRCEAALFEWDAEKEDIIRGKAFTYHITVGMILNIILYGLLIVKVQICRSEDDTDAALIYDPVVFDRRSFN